MQPVRSSATRTISEEERMSELIRDRIKGWKKGREEGRKVGMQRKDRRESCEAK